MRNRAISGRMVNPQDQRAEHDDEGAETMRSRWELLRQCKCVARSPTPHFTPRCNIYSGFACESGASRKTNESTLGPYNMT